MFGHRDDDSQQQDNDQQWQHPGEPLDSSPSHSGPVVSPSEPPVPPHDEPANDIATHIPSDQNPPPVHTLDEPHHTDDDKKSDLVDLSSQELVEIKQKALGELSPLMGHLDQNPEEKFRTLMMMIQASDDQSLVKQAYDVAQHIEDDKVRARALLDIVNEINYFTQQSEK